MPWLTTLLSKHATAAAWALGAMLAAPALAAIQGDWLGKLLVAFGAGGIAAVIIALGKYRLQSATARKIDAETNSNQFMVLIAQHNADRRLLERDLALERNISRLVRVSKHNVLDELQNAFDHIRLSEAGVDTGKFRFPKIKEIFKIEDDGMITIVSESIKRLKEEEIIT